MADVSYLQLHLNDDLGDGYDDGNDVNNWSHHLDAFDDYHPDLDCSLFSHTDRNLFDRENQVNFVIDMFHQRVEQSRVSVESDMRNPDRSFRHGNEGTDVNDLEAEFELGFHVEVTNNRNEPGDDFFVPRRTRVDPSRQSDCPECFTGEFSVPELESDNVAGETEIDCGIDGVGDYESDLRLAWDALQLEDENNPSDLNLIANVNQDFEWEEIDGGIDDREVLQMIFESEPDDYTSDLPGIPPNSHDTSELGDEQSDPLAWEVLLNAHNLEANPDLATGQFNGNNFTEYEMLFGQFANNNASSSGQPPASTTVVENLLSVVITVEDVEKNDTHCAICKDEIGTGLMAKQLPCSHRYHGDCIFQWLSIHNTCPVCRHELLTDDPDYERKKADRAARDH